jgi:cob(I)alamin adenosyltransferase
MVKLNKIYTRTGDTGSSGLVDGSRLPKDDALFAAIGDVDELNSVIGVAILALGDEATMARRLTVIQNDLFDLGADLATPAGTGNDPFAPGEMALRIIAEQVARLEVEIDDMNDALSPLTSFILPGGNAAAAHLHVARSVARRAERSAVAAAGVRALNPAALTYLNRLSDWLFVAARAANGNGVGDVLWVPGASRSA